MTRRTWRPQGRPGFTLIEVILASLISLLVISGIYIVYAGHSRVFAGQRMVSEAQTSARFATEIVKADLQRAGFMAVGTTKAPETRQHLCGTPDVGEIAAVDINQGTGFVHNPAGANLSVSPIVPPQQAPDELILVGNFVDSEVYWVDRRVTSQIYLQDTRTFDPSDPFPICAPEFERIFEANKSAVRIEYNNKVFFSRIKARDYATKRLDLASTPDCGVPGLWDGARLNAIQKVRYRVIQATVSPNLSPAEAALTPATNVLGQYLEARPVLVREFLSWDTGAPLSVETVADGVVDFQVWFLFDTYTAVSTLRPAVDQGGYPFADAVTGGPPCGTDDLGDADCREDRIASAIVRISVRTDREDPNFVHPGAATKRPLDWYEVIPSEPGAARVRTLVTQVDMPNIRYGP